MRRDAGWVGAGSASRRGFKSWAWRRLVLVLLALTLALVIFGAGEILSAPAGRVVGPPPSGFDAISVASNAAPGGRVAGWMAHGQPGKGAVLLLHGVRSDRRQMTDRGKFLHAAGYAVLLVDLPAHGESAGDRITFGHREAEGVRAAMRYLRESLPRERLAVIGVSLGAASFMLADDLPPPDVVVLESMYPTIAEAVTDRLEARLGWLGGRLAPLLLWQLPVRLGVGVDRLRPIDHLKSLHAPVLVASGAEDRYTTAAETRRLYDAATEPKALWLVPGAGHVDLHAFDPPAYEARVSAFLSRFMRQAAQ